MFDYEYLNADTSGGLDSSIFTNGETVNSPSMIVSTSVAGVYNIKVVGTMPIFTYITATGTFTVTITDPCSTGIVK